MKAEGFEAKNARGVGDFDSCGELFTWLAKRGFKPNWHVEPQDSVDFTIKQVQNFLLRLVHGEGNVSDQVESRRKQLELANCLEEEEGFGQSDATATDEEEAMSSIEYEGEEEFEEGDDNCLN